MQYFKNVELAKRYPVSEKAVRNWIEAVKKGKLDLTLYETSARSYIANTPKNLSKIETIIKSRRKYLNKRTRKTIQPHAQFYNVYRKEQILDIIKTLDTSREIPLQYAYYGEGAQYWKAFVDQYVKKNVPSIPVNTRRLLEINLEYIMNTLKDFKKVNIVCIGVESHISLYPLAAKIIEAGKLGRYVAVDPSEEMLKNVRTEVAEWFGDSVHVETHNRDIYYSRFNDILESQYFRPDADETANLILLLGSTIYNAMSPDETLRLAYHSTNYQDILIHDVRTFADNTNKPIFNLSHGVAEILTPHIRRVVDLLGLEASMYEVERCYDAEQKVRFIRLKLKVALSISFELPEGTRVLDFDKDESIAIFRYWHRNTYEVFNSIKASGFRLLHASIIEEEYMLTISDKRYRNTATDVTLM